MSEVMLKAGMFLQKRHIMYSHLLLLNDLNTLKYFINLTVNSFSVTFY